jgi:hypothetical protein
MAGMAGIWDGTGLVIGTGLGAAAGGACTMGLGVATMLGCWATADSGRMVMTASNFSLVTNLVCLIMMFSPFDERSCSATHCLAPEAQHGACSAGGTPSFSQQRAYSPWMPGLT